MKRIGVLALIMTIVLTVPAIAEKTGGFEGNYFWTADDAIITFTYADFHRMLDRLRDKRLDEYRQMFERWDAHMPRGPIYVVVLREYDDGILKVRSVNGDFDFFIFRDYLLAEF
jgi:hypothetical protein